MSQRPPFTLGFVGLMCIVTAFLILLYASTFTGELELSQLMTVMTAVVLLLTGVTLSFIMIGYRIVTFDIKQLIETSLWSAVAFLTMRVVHTYVPFNLEVTFLSPRLFAVLMGIAEECFFRMFLCALFAQMTRSDLLAIVMSSGIWTVYHFNRYGGSGSSTFLLIFLCGLVLGTVFLKSRRADPVLMSHGGWNWFAS